MANFTNFCCRSGGSNMNAGTVDGSTTEPATTPLVTYTGGDWNATTDVYTAPIGADMTEAQVGRFASLYVDGDTAPTTNQFLIARITAVDSGARTVTLSTTARATYGTEVSTGTGNRSMRIGGAWQGPTTSIAWFDLFPSAGLTNAAGDSAHVRMKNDQTTTIAAVVTWGSGDCLFVSGYSSTYGDGGQTTITGGTSGASFILFSISASGPFVTFSDLIFDSNGATGSSAGVSVGGNGSAFHRCVFRGMRGNGVSTGNVKCWFVECEAFGNNLSNTSGLAGFSAGGGSLLLRCVSHDNTTSNGAGFVGGDTAFVDCIADSNGNDGFRVTSAGVGSVFTGCDAYNNGSDGIQTGGSSVYIENCNLIDNTAYGINAANGLAIIRNCGYGSGTAANGSGTTNGNVDESGAVTYAANVTPWVDPANGDFTINLAAAAAAGRGEFLETASGYSGTVGYPSIGAAQAAASVTASGGAAGGRIFTGM